MRNESALRDWKLCCDEKDARLMEPENRKNHWVGTVVALQHCETNGPNKMYSFVGVSVPMNRLSKCRNLISCRLFKWSSERNVRLARRSTICTKIVVDEPYRIWANGSIWRSMHDADCRSQSSAAQWMCMRSRSDAPNWMIRKRVSS